MKGELLEALDASGTAVLDADDPATPGLAARTAATVVRVSARGTADCASTRSGEPTMAMTPSRASSSTAATALAGSEPERRFLTRAATSPSEMSEAPSRVASDTFLRGSRA